jgi:hypothetical protein
MISLFTFTGLSRSVVLIVCCYRFSGFHVVFRKIFRKIEHHAQFIPAIQIHSLTELAVASHAYLSKLGLRPEMNRFVEWNCGSVGTVDSARAIRDCKHLFRVFKTDQQWMIAPKSLLKARSIPPLHAPVVPTMTPSTSMTASLKQSEGP